MALELQLKLDAVTADCGQLTLTDTTTYGDTNPERSELAVFVMGYKKGLPTEVDVMLNITSNNANPVTDDAWYATITVDGWYSFPMYAVPLYDALTTYSLNQCVYHSSVFWKCIASATGIEPGTNPSFWTQLGEDAGAITVIDIEEDQMAVAEIIDALEAADNVTYEYFNFIVTCRSEQCYSKFVVGAAIKGCCEGCSDADLKQTYERLDVLLNATFTLCTQLKYAEAEEVVRNMIYICEKTKCVCD
jgi:hypothetical protein